MNKKKILTPQERKKQEISKHYEFCFNKIGEEKRFVKLSAYMLHHKNYIGLSSSAKIALDYMRDWATNCNQFWETRKFEYSASMLENLGLMSRRNAVNCLKELRERGFINAEFKNGAGAINRWSFSNRWYTGEKEPEPTPESYISVKNTPYYKSCTGRNVDRPSRGI